MKSLPSSQIKKRFRGLAALILLGLISTIISYPKQAAAQCSSPAGVAGQIIFGEDENIPAYCDGTDWIGMAGGNPLTGGGDYIPNAVHINKGAEGDQVVSTPSDTPLTNMNDSKQVTGSMWIKFNSTTNFAFYHGRGGVGLNLLLNYNSSISLNGDNNSDSNILASSNSTNFIGDQEWHHLMYSFDMADSNNFHIYLDDVDITPTPSTYIDDVVDLDFTSMSGSSFKLPGNTDTSDVYIADFWMESDLYLDLSVEANRRKFINASGNPVYLGTNGSLPTGFSPDIFLSGDTANWHVNKGSGGGNFTENGALSDASTTPYTPITQVVSSGLVAYYRMDETNGNQISDSSGNDYVATANAVIAPQLGAIDTAIDADEITINTDDIFDSLSEGTISAWIKWNGSVTSETSVFSLYNAGPDSYFQPLQVQNGEMKIWGCGVGFTSNSQPIKPGRWHHILYHSDASNGHKVYVDGVEIYSNASHAFFNNCNSVGNTSSYRIGHAGGFEQFDGPIDELRIYNRVLTEAEILELATAKDGIRYNESHRSLEFFDGNKFVSTTPQWPEPAPTKTIYNCSNPGDVCSDGTVFAGYSPDGNVPMFTTRCNQGLTWDGSSCTGSASSITFTDGGSNYLQTTANSNTDGDGNTAILLVEDSNSGVAGIQPHDAAVECDSLTTNGHSDWYLPSREELELIYTNRAEIGNLSWQTWSSTDPSGTAHAAFRIDFTSGAAGVATKNGSFRVRCVRQGSFTTGGVGSLIGHWKLDETTGSTAADSSGNGNNGSMNSNLVSEEDSFQGAVGTALHFKNKNPTVSNSGANAIINVPDLLSDTDDATLSAWVYPVRTANTAYMRLFGGVGWIAVINSNGTLSYTLSGGSALVSSAAFSTDRVWTHLVLTYDASTKEQKIFINGTEDASQTDSSISFANFLTGISHTFNGFEGGLDDVRLYSRVLTEPEITQLFNMGAPFGSITALPQGCPNIGDVCDDGTIYAGLSPDGNTEMYTTPQDAGFFTWNDGSANYTTTSITNLDTGDANTASLTAIDSDSVTAGFQTHTAAQYCEDLNAHGADDWYLPAENEMELMCTNQDAGALEGTFTDVGVPGAYYWTSTENNADPTRARHTYMASCTSNQNLKSSGRPIRCVRKGPAPRCANPYGVQGQMIYNACYRVVQYCDGARWIMIGKWEAVNECS